MHEAVTRRDADGAEAHAVTISLSVIWLFSVMMPRLAGEGGAPGGGEGRGAMKPKAGSDSYSRCCDRCCITQPGVSDPRPRARAPRLDHRCTRAACRLTGSDLQVADFHTPVKNLSCKPSACYDLFPAMCLRHAICVSQILLTRRLLNTRTPTRAHMIAVQQFEGRGRGLIAAVPISAGEAVLEDSPCLLWISRSGSRTSCASCLRSLAGMVGTVAHVAGCSA